MSVWRWARAGLLWGALLLGAHSPARAQALLTAVFPNGAQQGATVELRFAGENLPETAELLVDGPGIRPLGPFQKGVGRIAVEADAAPGVRWLRLAGTKSATTPRPFAVGTLPELLEKEPNDTTAAAQRIESLPVVLNGALPRRPDIDVFRVALRRGDCLVVAGESRALGAPTDLIVRIRDAAGRELAVQMGYRTRDPLLPFTAPADGEYLVELQDVMNNYSAVNESYVYRVTLTRGPWLDTVFPPGATAGRTTRLRFSGWNLRGVPGPGTVEQEVAVPEGAGERLELTAGGAPNAVSLEVGRAPEMEAPEPEGTPPPRIEPPVTIDGRLEARGDADSFQFAARRGDRLEFRTRARTLGSVADLLLQLRGPDGRLLASADDAGRGQRDPALLWTAPADGLYTVTVRDLARRGGEGFFYRLAIAPPEPVLEGTLSGPTVVVKPGEATEIPLTVLRRGVSGPLLFEAEGLPPGVSLAPVQPPPASGDGSLAVKLRLAAGPQTRPGFARFRLRLRCGDRTASARAEWVLATDRSGTLAEGTTEHLLLLVPAP